MNKNHEGQLGCEVVRDLLPLYIDGLASGQTAACVKSHLQTCPACAACHAAMAKPTPPPPKRRAELGVRFLKKVKKRHWMTLAGVAAALLLVVGGLYYFILGKSYPVPGSSVRVAQKYMVGEDILFLQLDIVGDVAQWGPAQAHVQYYNEAGQAVAANSPDAAEMRYSFSYTRAGWGTRAGGGAAQLQTKTFVVQLPPNANIKSILYQGRGNDKINLLQVWRRGEEVPPAPASVANMAAGAAGALSPTQPNGEVGTFMGGHAALAKA